MTNRILAATLLVALTTLPAFAASTMPSTGPAPTGGPVVTTGGEIDSPGEPFIPERPERANGTNVSPFSADPPRQQKPRGITNPGYSQDEAPYTIDCKASQDGWVSLWNATGVTIPEDTWFAVSYPVNQVIYHKVPFALEPGHGVEFTLSASTGPGFDCEAWVWKDAEVPQIKETAIP